MGYNAEKEAYVPPTPPVPKDWCEAQDPNTGKTYYYNRKTSETTWSRPEAAPLKLKKKKKETERRNSHQRRTHSSQSIVFIQVLCMMNLQDILVFNKLRLGEGPHLKGRATRRSIHCHACQ